MKYSVSMRPRRSLLKVLSQSELDKIIMFTSLGLICGELVRWGSVLSIGQSLQKQLLSHGFKI